MKSFVSLSDIHYPYEDPDAMKLVTQFLKDFKPDVLLFNGDIHDMPHISKYAVGRRELLKQTPLQDHLDHGIEGMHKLIDAARPREVKYALGNHEERWEPYLGSKAPELASLKCLEFDKVFKLDGIEWKRYGDGFWLNDRLFVYHGGYVGANWTEKERKAIGASSITGHQHKQGVSYFTDRSRSYKNIGQGCLCKLNPPYLKTPADWQQGFVYGWIIDDDKFRAIETEIVRGADEIWMCPEGQVYRTALASPERRATKTGSSRTRQTTRTRKSGTARAVPASTVRPPSVIEDLDDL